MTRNSFHHSVKEINETNLEINRASNGPLNGARIAVEDILEFRDVNRRAQKGGIWSNYNN